MPTDKTKNSKKSFMMYFDDIDSINLLSDEQAGKLLKGLYTYTVDGEVTDYTDDGMLQMIYFQITNKIKRDTEKWLEKQARNIEIGRLGGIAKRENQIKEDIKRADKKINY